MTLAPAAPSRSRARSRPRWAWTRRRWASAAADAARLPRLRGGTLVAPRGPRTTQRTTAGEPPWQARNRRCTYAEAPCAPRARARALPRGVAPRQPGAIRRDAPPLRDLRRRRCRPQQAQDARARPCSSAEPAARTERARPGQAARGKAPRARWVGLRAPRHASRASRRRHPPRVVSARCARWRRCCSAAIISRTTSSGPCAQPWRTSATAALRALALRAPR
mmetsp:Transcript_24581/g.76596  ORF Transcript_24581/g.76596 Transcript_24581/m.76596 type:complete len:222 (+) Transcript_24581:4301-4966(+)